MRFHLIVNLARTAVAQLPRRRSLVLYNHQCRAYIPSGHHHQFKKKARVTETSSQFFTYFSILRRSYSSKSSNSNMGLLSWYLGMLDLRPILTKSISAAIIYGAADITSQLITMEPHDTWDSIRTLRIAGFGLIILGPAQHLWFNFVARVLPKRDMVTTFKKLAMGQLVYGPMINGVFFSFNAALQGESGNEIVARLKRDLIPTLLNGLMYWPLCDFFTYKIISVHLQDFIHLDETVHLLFEPIICIVKLKQDVRTCEYEDVHILWDMLKRKETHMSADTIRKGPFSELVQWAKHTTLCCRGGT
ncbi:hypothetical protein DH2020_008257 [Rehmannia glutinosa]|uniref:Uncharacterized protein n=1 Tax=Rehmannia glutinosa TaxID=99300 RepID=A0ABR0U0G3_REHGL